MIKNKKSRFLSGVVFALLAATAAGVFLLSRGETVPTYAQKSGDMASNKSTNYRELSGINMLSSLLAVDGVTIAETEMLPASVDSSKMAVVSIESAETNSNNAQFQSDNPRASILSLKDIHDGKSSLARQRSIELSPSQILIIAADQNRHTLWWDLVPDPRVFHAETGDSDGNLSGETVFKTSTSLLATFPDDKRITELRFYHPNWDGKSFSLQLIGNLTVPVDGK